MEENTFVDLISALKDVVDNIDNDYAYKSFLQDIYLDNLISLKRSDEIIDESIEKYGTVNVIQYGQPYSYSLYVKIDDIQYFISYGIDDLINMLGDNFNLNICDDYSSDYMPENSVSLSDYIKKEKEKLNND